MEKNVQKPVWHSMTIRLPYGVYERLKEMAMRDERKLASYIGMRLAVLSAVGKEVKNHDNS